MLVSDQRREALTQCLDNRGIASFPILMDWDEFWKTWGPQIVGHVGHQGWVLFLMDAIQKSLELQLTMSRLLRKKTQDTRGWSQAEWLNVADQTEEGLRWFERNLLDPKSLPEWAQFFQAGLYGQFTTMARLGREIRQLQDHGYNTLVVERDAAGVRLEAE